MTTMKKATMFTRIKKAYRWIRYTDSRLKKRSIRFLYQRLTRGWDDGDTFSLDYSLAKEILPRLKRFKEITVGDYNTASPEHQQWYDDLDKMIASFEWYGSETRWADNEFEMKEKHQEGLDLFAKHYCGLWW